MWYFGPDQIWEDKEKLYIRTPRFQEDWPIREYRKLMLRFQGKAYFPASAVERDRNVVYCFEPFDPTIEMPGVTIDYDEEYVKIREGNRKRPIRMTLAAIAAVLILGGMTWAVLRKDNSGFDLAPGPSHLLTASGDRFDMSDYRGNFVWLDFSAPWCPPCRSQAPQMKKLEHGPANATYVTVLVTDASRRPPIAATAKQWADQFGLDPEFVVADTTGMFSRKFNVSSIPLNVLLSPEGKILYSRAGTHSATQIRTIIDKHR